jgi:PEP-CTERM motif
MRVLGSAILILASTALGAPAFAATTISFTSGGPAGSGYSSSGAAVAFTSNGITATVTGWSVNSRGVISPGQLGVWSSGIGVRNSSTDNSHTIDNSGWTDFLLLRFAAPVRLEDARFNTGWHSMNDTDATIGYGNASLSQISALGGQSWSVPWLTTYQSGSVGASGNSTRSINPQGLSGNTWLIGASFSNPDRRLDGFKLQSISVNSAVPEPGTWMTMLLGFGLLGGAMRYRRRQQTRVSLSF